MAIDEGRLDDKDDVNKSLMAQVIDNGEKASFSKFMVEKNSQRLADMKDYMLKTLPNKLSILL